MRVVHARLGRAVVILWRGGRGRRGRWGVRRRWRKIVVDGEGVAAVVFAHGKGEFDCRNGGPAREPLCQGWRKMVVSVLEETV